MQRRHYEDLGQKINLPLDYNDYDEEETGLFTTKSDYLRIINLAKLRNITVDQQFNLGEHNQDVEYDKLTIIANELERYKKEYGLIDFNDMILDFVKSDKSPKFDVVFIDEAQDLSRMQWDMVHHFNTQDSFIAGDDDQAIFRWAGADVDRFITQTGKLLHLTQSMRIPRSVHDFAMKIIERVSNRIHKEWKPRTVEGSVNMYESFEDVDLSKGEWMVLTRTRHMLDAIEDTLKTKGFYFENKFKKSFEKDIQEAAIDWHQLLKGQFLNYKQLENIAKYMGPGHWHKKKMKGMVKESYYGIDQLIKDYGLQVKTDWFHAFDDCSTNRKEYIRAMRRNGESLKDNPRIHLSTIHSVKGGEKQNVVLLTDLTHNTNKAYEKNPDDENRLFYVGATRAKENLHIIQPKDDYKSFQIGGL